MRMPPFRLHRPASVDEAVGLAAEIISGGSTFDWVAGGTDLLPNYKWHLNAQPNVISLAGIDEMTALTATHIGGMTRIQALVESGETHPLLRQTASTIASVLLRRSGTVGGNICLDTRCFWFNQTEEWRRSIEWCHKCDCGTGADCLVIANQNTLCVATYQADMAPALMCLDAVIELAGPDGRREMPLADFFQEDGMTRNHLAEGELVVAVRLPEDVAEWSGSYQKLRLREAWDFPEAGVAAAWHTADSGSIDGLRMATTGCESIPRLHDDLTVAALSEWSGEESVKRLSEAVRKAVKPVNNTAFPPSYRRKMLRVLSKRALSGALTSG